MEEGEFTEVEDCPPDAGADDCPRDCTAMEGQGYLECCGGVRLGGVVLVSWAMLINVTHIYFLRRWTSCSTSSLHRSLPHISPMSPYISLYLPRWTTCSVTFVTRLRLSLLGLALFGQLITLFMILIHWDGWFLVLCIGGGLALFGLICFAIYMICFAPPPKHETEQVKRDRIEKARQKMLKKKGGVPPPPADYPLPAAVPPPPPMGTL